jgi:signal transduction histidine kinase
MAPAPRESAVPDGREPIMSDTPALFMRILGWGTAVVGLIVAAAWLMGVQSLHRPGPASVPLASVAFAVLGLALGLLADRPPVERSLAARLRTLQGQLRLRDLTDRANAAAGAEPDLARAFDAFAQVVATSADFERASYSRANSEDQFVIAAVWGPDLRRLDVGSTVPMAPHYRTRFDEVETIVEPDLSLQAPEDEAYAAWLAKGIRSAVVVPVVAGGSARSLYAFTSTEVDHFPPEAVTLLRAAVLRTAPVFEMLFGLERERQAVQRLREIDQMKNEFVRMVAHDLRSPMAVISGFADALRLGGDSVTPHERTEFLSTISRNVHGLSAIVEDMLEVVRLESGDYSLRIEPFKLDVVVERTSREVTQAAGGRTAEVTIASPLPLAQADERRVWQILTNLLTNACKFSPPDTPIGVVVTAEDTQLRIEITDQGPGVAPEDQQRIFDKFTRLQNGDNAKGRGVKGSGLGLYICRSLVESMGGRVGVRSLRGDGATFWFTLPAATD